MKTSIATTSARIAILNSSYVQLGAAEKNIDVSSKKTVGLILNCSGTDANGYVFYYAYGSFNTGDTIEFENAQFFDLTLMGLDNITSVDEFKALFPLDYYPYQESNIKSTIVSKIEAYSTEGVKLGEINIPNAPLTLNGVNDIHNTLAFEEQEDGTYNAILTKKIGIVDFGTLNWIKSGSTDSGNQRFISTTLQKSMPVVASTQSLSNVLSKDYATATQLDAWRATKDKTIGTYPSGENCWLLIVDNDYADKTEQELKASLSGKKMLYETTTPTSEVIATGLTFDQVSFLMEKGGTIKAVYEEVPPTASVDFMTKGE